MSSWQIVAAIAPLVFVAYLVITEWVPMFPFNDLEASSRQERLDTAKINYPVGIAISGLFALGHPVSVLVAAGLTGLVVVGHVMSWWLPYFGILTFDGQREAYKREYARTLKLLPVEGHEVVPDAQHMVVGVIAIVMLVSGLATAAELVRF
jgi:hypothetical protein